MDRSSSLRRRHSGGFSLLEILTTLAIAGILAVAAISSQDLLQTSILKVDLGKMRADLGLARHEAAARKQPVTVCKSNDGTQCTRASAWKDGWIVFVDIDADRRVDPGETVLSVQPALSGRTRLKFDGAFNQDHNLTFRPTGSVSPNGTFTFCDADGDSRRAKAIIVVRTGRARISNKKANGRDRLDCSDVPA